MGNPWANEVLFHVVEAVGGQARIINPIPFAPRAY